MPSHWPHELDTVLAKSQDRGGETLAQHTWDVLEKLAALHHLRPTMPTLAGTPRLWHCLFWTCLLHDFGKAARGFQNMLNGGDLWKQRHEVLSLACFDWIAEGLTEEDRRGIVAAIVSHHRDAAEIRKSYYADEEDDPLVPLLAEFEPAVVSKLWHWIDDCAADWMSALGFNSNEVHTLPLMPHEKAVALVQKQGAQRVRFWLKCYHRWVSELGEYQPAAQKVLPIFLRGLTTTADHMASAHLKDVPEPIRESWDNLARRIFQTSDPPFHAHQQASAKHAGRSVLLVAPTGSGKTEAALYWALGDGSVPTPRIFYALPYQASMNAMFLRLGHQQKGWGAGSVGLQHGRALQALYVRLMDQEKKSRDDATSAAKWERNLNTLHARPIKVFSPYQMLKAAFQLRGFEGMLTDYAQAAFIFDEIHAYEPKRLALILAMIAYLRENYGARFFVMSATFPELIRGKLTEALALQPEDTITADESVFQKFRRHRLHLLEGELPEEGIARIVDDVRAGKKVLVCLTTVRRAQDVRMALLAAGLPREQVLLIHSRYIMKDRTRREEQIMKRCGLESESQPLALVATQVVEVSLNIDLDTIYTEPAPLEALLQRFGRVNRACKKGICPVHVFRRPDDGQHIYDWHQDSERCGRIVRVTLDELERHHGEEIDESQTGVWLNHIYNDSLVRTRWEEEYQDMAKKAERILDYLQPFNSDPQKEEEFEQMFDNIEVLPKCFEQEYLQCLLQEDFLEASNYLVGISTRKHRVLASKGHILQLEDPEGKKQKWMVRLPYDEETGLSFETNAVQKDPDWD